MKKGELRNFAKFAGKHLFQTLFLIKLQALGLQLYEKRDCGTGVSCEFCEISKKTFFTERPCSTTSKLMYYRPINHLNLGQI